MCKLWLLSCLIFALFFAICGRTNSSLSWHIDGFCARWRWSCNLRWRLERWLLLILNSCVLLLAWCSHWRRPLELRNAFILLLLHVWWRVSVWRWRLYDTLLRLRLLCNWRRRPELCSFSFLLNLNACCSFRRARLAWYVRGNEDRAVLCSLRSR